MEDCNYYSIIAYWKDTRKHFQAVVSDSEEILESDTGIFYYGLSEELLENAVKSGEDTKYKFVIVEYELMDSERVF